MEIEIGEYVRTQDGIIFKTDFVGQSIVIDKTDKYTYSKRDIVKHSPNLIDLIEVGDIVNKQIINTISKDNEENIIVWHCGFYGDDDVGFKNKDIQTILTKEQYEQNCFKV